MIPVFPQFKKLELSDKAEIVQFTNEFEPFSDFNFISLWVYNTENDATVSFLNKNLVIKYRDYLNNDVFMTFLGNQAVTNTVQTLLDFAKENALFHGLKLIPEANLKNNKELFQNFSVTEDPDNFDYILEAKKYVDMSGGTFQKIRKKMNKLTRDYPELDVKVLDLQEKGVQKDIFQLFHTWARIKKKELSEVSHELKALERALLNHEELNIHGFGVYYKGEMISFIIFDTISKTHAQSHFLKSHPEFLGASQYLRHHSSKYLSIIDRKFINIEQDLGILGLRKAKQQWRPHSFLKKYIIEPK